LANGVLKMQTRRTGQCTRAANSDVEWFAGLRVFAAALSRSLDASLKKTNEMLKTTNGFARGAKYIRLLAAWGFPPRRV